MAITPAKVAGVKTIICASPPKDKNGAHPGIIYAADLCGADIILNLVFCNFSPNKVFS